MLKHFHRPLWAALMRHGQRVLAVGALACTLVLFGYSLLALAFALLVVAALSPSSWLHRIRIPGAARLALWSYSIYLSHKAVAFVLQRALQPFGLPAPALFVVIALASVAAGWLLYRAIEAPLLALRDRRVPSSFSSPATPPPARAAARA